MTLREVGGAKYLLPTGRTKSTLILVSSSGDVKAEERSRKQLVLLSRKYTERSLD